MATNATTSGGYDEYYDDEIITDADNLFPELYRSLLFLLALWVCGDFVCGKIIRLVPPLVGQIAVGILFGPHGFDLLFNVSCWPTLGEIGLVLMLCQAGLDMDFDVLQAVGPRGALMALVGSILPSSIGFLVAYFVLDLSPEAALCVGCSFGPTSAGIALNVLQQCDVLKTPLGQLIVAIAIVDDIIALVVLSQLQALTGGDSVTAATIVIPIVSALLWLFLGGAVALYVMPRIIGALATMEEIIFGKLSNSGPEARDASNTTNATTTIPDSMHMAHIMLLLFALLPATYYSEASHLLGAFLAGLCVCQESESARVFNRELAKITTWLMRIFFGASIAFRIPVELFQDAEVIGTGFLLSLSLLGKIMTGLLLTPVHLQVTDSSAADKIENEEENSVIRDNNNNNNNSNHISENASGVSSRRRYDRQHVRDCLVVGFSMAGEAEFAMLVAAFGFTEGLVEENIYASTIFAILLSTILSPCLLRLTLALFPDPSSESNDDIISRDGNDNGKAQEEDVGDLGEVNLGDEKKNGSDQEEEEEVGEVNISSKSTREESKADGGRFDLPFFSCFG